MKILHLVSISGSILLVYRTAEGDYSYEIYFHNGSIYHPYELYQYVSQALEVGRKILQEVARIQIDEMLL